MKIIFLDIDGVICILDKDLQSDEYGHLFKLECIANLQWLIEQTGAKIVISSTWRYKGLSTMREMWKKRKMAGEILDITPDTAQLVKHGTLEYYDQVERGHEIQEWLDNNPVDTYVIFDDDQDMLESQQPHFVQCNTSEGLTKEKALQAAEILLKKL